MNLVFYLFDYLVQRNFLVILIILKYIFKLLYFFFWCVQICEVELYFEVNNEINKISKKIFLYCNFFLLIQQIVLLLGD